MHFLRTGDRSPDLVTGLEFSGSERRLRSVLTAEKPESIELVGCRRYTDLAGNLDGLLLGLTSIRLDYQIGFRHGLLLVVVEPWVAKKVIGYSRLHFGPPRWDIENQFRLSEVIREVLYFRDLSLGFVLAAVSLMLSAAAAVRCVRSKARMKWRWLLVILVGFGRYSVGWRHGLEQWQWVSVQVPVISWYRLRPTSPWVISSSVPLGAIIFLWKTRKRTTPAKSEEHTEA